MTQKYTNYEQGFIDGLRAYAINKDGTQWVGPPEKKLSSAINDLKYTWNFNPPEDMSAELLEALETVKKYIEQDGQHIRDLYPVFGLDGQRVRDQVNKAIAKARGAA